jgi:hypothetical protein
MNWKWCERKRRYYPNIRLSRDNLFRPRFQLHTIQKLERVKLPGRVCILKAPSSSEFDRGVSQCLQRVPGQYLIRALPLPFPFRYLPVHCSRLTVAACSMYSVNHRNINITAFWNVTAYSLVVALTMSTLKMESSTSSQLLVLVNQIVWCHITVRPTKGMRMQRSCSWPSSAEQLKHLVLEAVSMKSTASVDVTPRSLVEV